MALAAFVFRKVKMDIVSSLGIIFPIFNQIWISAQMYFPIHS